MPKSYNFRVGDRLVDTAYSPDRERHLTAMRNRLRFLVRTAKVWWPLRKRVGSQGFRSRVPRLLDYGHELRVDNALVRSHQREAMRTCRRRYGAVHRIPEVANQGGFEGDRMSQR